MVLDTLISFFIVTVGEKIKTKNNRLEQKSIQNALKIITTLGANFCFALIHLRELIELYL